MTYVGIDVGGSRKGFHAVAVDGGGVVAGPERLPDVQSALSWVTRVRPRIIAIDSPRTCAPPGGTSRAGERELARRICGIRWTPDEARIEGSPYYEWIRRGLALYRGLARGRWSVIEVFPTASWTVWFGRRERRSRASWTSDGLLRMNLEGLPDRRLNQDDRDSIAAAVTARLHDRGRTRDQFGEIIVPAEPWPGRGLGRLARARLR